jgi:hypothetical protein
MPSCCISSSFEYHCEFFGTSFDAAAKAALQAVHSQQMADKRPSDDLITQQRWEMIP